MNEVLQEDCRNMDFPQADLLLTDPPYGISKDTGFTNTKDKRYANYVMDYGKWDEEATDHDLLAINAARWLKKGGTAIIFYDLWKFGDLARSLSNNGFSKIRLIVWNKKNPVPINSTKCYLSNAREVAVCAVKGNVKANAFHAYYHSGSYDFPLRDSSKNLHPTQKHIGLIKKLIEVHSNEGDLVLDPYCGSGTTCLAAKELGRNFIGVDIDEGYCSIARNRLSGNLENKPLFADS